MILITNEARVWDESTKRFVAYKFYKKDSAIKHTGGEYDQELKLWLQKALNSDQQISQGNNVFRFRINGNLGYIVYKTGVDGPHSACIFHYHWNYHLEDDLSVN